ncbi:MAG TPA: hypothetical protein PKV71_17560, partial [Calditrichia bacterium]|nr:hypothetical protein [Calditrichia bacterium]
HHFDYKTYRGHQENWSTTQDSLGRIYVANNSGILIFDGARWQLVRNPANAAVLSVDYAPDGRVYAGLESDFGYLESDSLGFPQYVSLKDRLPDSLRTFQQVWKVHALPNAVYFFTVKRVFRWDGSELSLFHNYSISALSNKVGNRIFFGDYGQGIMVGGEDSLYRLPGCEDFLREENFVVTGGGKPEELLLITRGRGIFRYHQGQFSTFPTPVGERLRKAAVYCGTTMPDGRLLLGTIRDGLLVLDQNGALLYHVNKDEGLKENTVVHAFVDAQNGIWLAEVNGITRLEPDAGMGTFGEAEGLKGNVLSLLGSSGGIYAGTHEGLFRLKEGPPGKRGEFDTVSGIRSFTHALSEQDGQILAGTDRGVFIVEGNQARFIDVAWPRVYGFHRGKAHPEQIYVALLNGLSIMRKNASGAWDHHRRVQGIEREIRAIGGDRDDRLWLAPAGGGLLRVSVRYPDNPSELLTAAIDTFGQAHNLPGGEVSIAEINGENLFITGNAILIFDEDRQQFAPHPLMEGAYRGKGHQLTAIQNNGNRIWIAGQERDEPFLDLINLADPAKKVRFQRLRDLGLISAVWAEANFLLLGAAEGIVLLYPDRVFKPADAFAVVLHQVRINDGEKVRGIGW